MSDNTIFVKRYSADNSEIPVREREIWRYAGYMGVPDSNDEELNKLLQECINETGKAFSYKVCYRRMEIGWEDGMPVLPFDSTSKDLAKCLEGSKEVIIFAATIGLNIDRFIAKYQRISPTKALILQAYGAERIEGLCDKFCKEIEGSLENEGLHATARFSPGYGDLPLEKQVDFFKLLDCNRQIGISLNDSLLMTPSKSVTAIFGINNKCRQQIHDKCDSCTNINCEYRMKE